MRATARLRPILSATQATKQQPKIPPPEYRPCVAVNHVSSVYDAATENLVNRTANDVVGISSSRTSRIEIKVGIEWWQSEHSAHDRWIEAICEAAESHKEDEQEVVATSGHTAIHVCVDEAKV